MGFVSQRNALKTQTLVRRLVKRARNGAAGLPQYLSNIIWIYCFLLDCELFGGPFQREVIKYRSRMLEDIIALRRVEVCDEGWHNFIKFITCATAGDYPSLCSKF
jgi:hypothetical protein